jgi:hypothetical protein
MENRLYRREKGGDENVSLFETSALACLYITWVDGEEAHGTRALNIKQRFAPRPLPFQCTQLISQRPKK